MSKTTELIKAIHRVMKMDDDLVRLARTVEKLAENHLAMERRLSRIEGMIELSLAQQAKLETR